MRISMSATETPTRIEIMLAASASAIQTAAISQTFDSTRPPLRRVRAENEKTPALAHDVGQRRSYQLSNDTRAVSRRTPSPFKRSPNKLLAGASRSTTGTSSGELTHGDGGRRLP